jgi:hypothetical protein
MTTVITSSFLGLEGQTSSSLEDDGIGHLHSSLLNKEKDGHCHTISFLRLEGKTPSSLEDMP